MTTDIVERANTPGMTLSDTTLSVLDPNMTLEQIGERLNQAAALGDTARWWAGDLILYAEARWAEEAAQMLGGVRLTEHQIKDYRWVAEKIAPALRNANLSFSHHRAVAPLEPPDQARLLAMADAGRMALHDFQEAVKDHKALTGPPPKPPTQIVVSTDTTAVDAARGLRTARATIRTIATEVPTATESLKLPEAQRGIDAAMKIVQRNSPLEDVLVAVTTVIEEGKIQTGLADPAVIVPSGAWSKLVAAHERATEGRK